MVLVLMLMLVLILVLTFAICGRNYYENLIPASPTDHMELREGSNEDEDFDDQEEDQVCKDRKKLTKTRKKRWTELEHKNI